MVDPTPAQRVVLPAVPSDDPVARLVAWSLRLMFKHPASAKAGYAALVREGRAFAATEEGRAWRARLEASEELRRLRPLWETATANVLDGAEDGALPTQFIDLVAQSLSRADLDAVTAWLAETSELQRGPEVA